MSDMRAVQYRAYGGPEKLELVDWKIASGKFRLIMPAKFPCVPGYDLAGEVVEVGPGVADFAPGARVHARITGKGGASAQLAVAGVDVTVPMPSGMDPGEAAGLPLAGMTALQGLRDRAGLPLTGARERVLVVGASGGVGHLAVQIARASGATVVGVCSARNAELVAGLGAHEVLDYTKPEPYRGQPPFDVVLDCVAGDPAPWCALLGPGGRYASCVPGPKVFLRAALNPLASRKVRAVMLQSRAADLRLLDGLVEAGKLRVVVDSRFPLADLAKAWERSLRGRAVGKIIVDVAAA